MDVDFGSKFLIVWMVTGIVIGIFGTVFYKVVQDIKKKQMGKLQYVYAFVVSLLLGLIFEWGLFYLAL